MNSVGSGEAGVIHHKATPKDKRNTKFIEKDLLKRSEEAEKRGNSVILSIACKLKKKLVGKLLKKKIYGIPYVSKKMRKRPWDDEQQQLQLLNTTSINTNY